MSAEVSIWLELAKLVVSLATPIIVVIFGTKLLHRTEGVKSKVARQSDFHKKWAEQFFGCCQEFMDTVERHLAILSHLVTLQENPNAELENELKKEMVRLQTSLIELEARIGRNVIFAKKNGVAVIQTAEACLHLLRTQLASKQIRTKEIIEKMNEFNMAARNAHEEMLDVASH